MIRVRLMLNVLLISLQGLLLVWLHVAHIVPCITIYILHSPYILFIRIHSYTKMPSMIIVITILIFFLINSNHLSQSEAKPKRSSNSLVLPMTHSRLAISKPSNNPNLETSLDYMMEPLRGFRDGYLISLNLGSPPQVIQAYMDTGSDLTWVPCGNISFDCMECDEYRNYKLTATFSPSRSTSALRDFCTSPLCINVHSSDNPYDTCAVAGCSVSSLVSRTCPRPCPSFAYNYGAGGLIVGSLTRDTLRIHLGHDPGLTRDFSNFCFGCVGSTFREPIGIAGFGKGALSLPSQLGYLHKGFSHCFLGFKFANNPNISSPLVIGDSAVSSNQNIQFTQMLKNPVYPSYYYISLEGITVGNDTSIDVPLILREFDAQGNGALLIDSGTTYTHLPEPLYSRLLTELRSKITYERSADDEDRTGFDLCYKVPIVNTLRSDDLPLITLNFLGNVELVLPKENCFYAVGAPKGPLVTKCLLFQCMEDGDYGPAGVFGSFQQQNMEVLYDLEKERIGFQPMDCSSSAASHGLYRK